MRFSDQCTGSKMYQQLSKFISSDLQILSIAANGNQAQPIPNLFLAAIHFLLLKDKSSPLAIYYPSLGGRFVDSTDFKNTFKNFAVTNSEKIIQLTKTRTVQTNEVRRCAQLIAGLSIISEKIENRPITLIDIGTSSG